MALNPILLRTYLLTYLMITFEVQVQPSVRCGCLCVSVSMDKKLLK